MLSIYRSIAVMAVLTLAALAGIVFLGPGTASADAGGNASCIGFEASGISPPGSSDEFPGGVPEVHAFLDSLGLKNRGELISQVAKLHLGSHEACDAE